MISASGAVVGGEQDLHGHALDVHCLRLVAEAAAAELTRVQLRELAPVLLGHLAVVEDEQVVQVRRAVGVGEVGGSGEQCGSRPGLPPAIRPQPEVAHDEFLVVDVAVVEVEPHLHAAAAERGEDVAVDLVLGLVRCPPLDVRAVGGRGLVLDQVRVVEDEPDRHAREPPADQRLGDGAESSSWTATSIDSSAPSMKRTISTSRSSAAPSARGPTHASILPSAKLATVQRLSYCAGGVKAGRGLPHGCAARARPPATAIPPPAVQVP
jgi:hypothetical protein